MAVGLIGGLEAPGSPQRGRSHDHRWAAHGRAPQLRQGSVRIGRDRLEQRGLACPGRGSCRAWLVLHRDVRPARCPRSPSALATAVHPEAVRQGRLGQELRSGRSVCAARPSACPVLEHALRVFRQSVQPASTCERTHLRRPGHRGSRAVAVPRTCRLRVVVQTTAPLRSSCRTARIPPGCFFSVSRSGAQRAAGRCYAHDERRHGARPRPLRSRGDVQRQRQKRQN